MCAGHHVPELVVVRSGVDGALLHLVGLHSTLILLSYTESGVPFKNVTKITISRRLPRIVVEILSQCAAQVNH